jgi:hypothetical protein
MSTEYKIKFMHKYIRHGFTSQLYRIDILLDDAATLKKYYYTASLLNELPEQLFHPLTIDIIDDEVVASFIVVPRTATRATSYLDLKVYMHH